MIPKKKTFLAWFPQVYRRPPKDVQEVKAPSCGSGRGGEWTCRGWSVGGWVCGRAHRSPPRPPHSAPQRKLPSASWRSNESAPRHLLSRAQRVAAVGHVPPGRLLWAALTHRTHRRRRRPPLGIRHRTAARKAAAARVRAGCPREVIDSPSERRFATCLSAYLAHL